MKRTDATDAVPQLASLLLQDPDLSLPEKSRSVLFKRMLTIVYVAQDTEIKSVPEPVNS